jgi:hypothetical protein
VIDSGYWHPRSNSVAIFANIGRLYVALILAGGIYPIVATETVGIYIRVIKISRCPRYSCMAIVTIITACDVLLVLSCRDCSVMAR